MTDFLNWIYAQASKVYDWFGDAYNDLRNGAANAWNWAYSQAQNAITTAVNYAYSQFQVAESDIGNLFGWVDNQVQLVKTSIANGLANLKNDLLSDLDAAYNVLLKDINAVYSVITTSVANAVTSIQSWVNSVVPGLISTALSPLQWVINIQQALQNIALFFSADHLTRAATILVDDYDALLAFLSNPLVWLFDLLSHSMISALCWIIAWALGAVSSDLPLTPPWRQ